MPSTQEKSHLKKQPGQARSSDRRQHGIHPQPTVGDGRQPVQRSGSDHQREPPTSPSLTRTRVATGPPPSQQTPVLPSTAPLTPSQISQGKPEGQVTRTLTGLSPGILGLPPHQTFDSSLATQRLANEQGSTALATCESGTSHQTPQAPTRPLPQSQVDDDFAGLGAIHKHSTHDSDPESHSSDISISSEDDRISQGGREPAPVHGEPATLRGEPEPRNEGEPYNGHSAPLSAAPASRNGDLALHNRPPTRYNGNQTPRNRHSTRRHEQPALIGEPSGLRFGHTAPSNGLQHNSDSRKSPSARSEDKTPNGQ